MINVTLRLSVTSPPTSNSSLIYYYLHAISACIIEHVAFVVVIRLSVSILCPPEVYYHGIDKFRRKMYLAHAFPELVKIVAIILQTWDKEASLLFFIGVLVHSLQFTSLVSICHQYSRDMLLIFVCGTLARLGCRILISSIHQVIALGILL